MNESEDEEERVGGEGAQKPYRDGSKHATDDDKPEENKRREENNKKKMEWGRKR